MSDGSPDSFVTDYQEAILLRKVHPETHEPALQQLCLQVSNV